MPVGIVRNPGKPSVDVRMLFMGKNPSVASRLPGWVYDIIRRPAYEDELNRVLHRLGNLGGRRFAEAALAILDIRIKVVGRGGRSGHDEPAGQERFQNT